MIVLYIIGILQYNSELISVSRYGETDEDILRYYATQQQRLRGLCERSELDTLALDTTDTNIEDAVNKVLDFWGAV